MVLRSGSHSTGSKCQSKKKGRALCPAFLTVLPRELDRLDVARLLALRALGHFEADLLAFLQGLESRHVDRREVSEQIFAAAVRCNETETLGVVEPLDCTSCHFCNSSRKIKSCRDGFPPHVSISRKNGNGCNAVA